MSRRLGLSLVAACAAIVGLFAIAESLALVVTALLVIGAWLWLVLFGEGERELKRFDRTWGLRQPTTSRRRRRRGLAEKR